MAKQFFATFPNDDLTLSYLFNYGKEVVGFAESRGVDAVKFEHGKAVRRNVESFLSANNPGLVYFTGHGSDNSVCGYKQEPIIVSGENERLLKSKIIYSLSCSSASVLGEEAVGKGAKAFIGYKDDFVFLFDKNKTLTPLKDEIARNFLEPSNALILSLLKGNAVEKAFDISQKSFEKKISKLLTSEAILGHENLVAFLLWDRTVQVFHGEGTASF